MNDQDAYRTGNYGPQIYALDAIISAFETQMISYALWNYNPVNSSFKYGDCWNKEDFSIYCPEDPLILSTIGLRTGYSKKHKHRLRRRNSSVAILKSGHDHRPHQEVPSILSTDSLELLDPLSTKCVSVTESSLSCAPLSPVRLQLTPDQLQNLIDVYEGGRALEAFIRPHVFKITGIPQAVSFDLSSRVFILEYVSNTQHWSNGIYTEIFVPWLHYPYGVDVKVSDGEYKHDMPRQTLYYKHDPLIQRHLVTLSPKSVKYTPQTSSTNMCTIQ
jgi:hypothetical protein